MLHYKSIILLILSSAALFSGLKAVSDSAFLFQEFRVYEGRLIHSEDKKDMYVVTEQDQVTLTFVNDDIEKLVIDDMGVVQVYGFYSRVHGKLLVEEIMDHSVTIL